MAESSNSSNAGLGIATILFLIFLTLKLAEIGQVAAWSWLWVTSPLWISAGLWISIVAGAFAFATLAGTMAQRRRLKGLGIRGW